MDMNVEVKYIMNLPILIWKTDLSPHESTVGNYQVVEMTINSIVNNQTINQDGSHL